MQLEIPETLRPALSSRYPRRPRLLYLLRRRPEASRALFESALTQWRRDRPGGVEAGALIVRAGAAIVERQQDISGRFRAWGSEVTALDGYVSLDLERYDPSASDFDALFEAGEGCLDSLETVVDRTGSIALAGVANLPIPGLAPLSMILLLDRAASLSLLDYNSWWVRHGDDHRKGFPAQVGYHQLHTDPAFNALAAKAAGTSTTDQCITDIMYLGDLDDAFTSVIDPASAEGRAVSADIGQHVSVARVSGALFKEV